VTQSILLVSPALEHEADAADYVADCFSAGEMHIHGGGAIEEFDRYRDWLAFNERNKSGDTVRPGWVPGETFFGIREHDGRIVGMINLRYSLSEYLLQTGGHVGYSVRPRERRKGYASEMLRKALEILKSKGITRALVTCDEDNPASAGTIKKNGGVLENCVWDDEDKSWTQRYWIEAIDN